MCSRILFGSVVSVFGGVMIGCLVMVMFGVGGKDFRVWIEGEILGGFFFLCNFLFFFKGYF